MHNVLKRIFEYLRLRSNILSYYCGWIYYLIIAVEYFLLLLQWNVIFCYYGKYFILLLQFSAHVGRNTKSVHQNSTRAYSKFIKEYNSCTIYIYLYKYVSYPTMYDCTCPLNWSPMMPRGARFSDGCASDCRTEEKNRINHEC